MNVLKLQLLLIGLCLAIIPLLAEQDNTNTELNSLDGSSELKNKEAELSEKDKRYRLHGKRSVNDEIESESDELNNDLDLDKRYRLYGKRYMSSDDLLGKRYRLAGKRYRLYGKRYRLYGKRNSDMFDQSNESEDQENEIEKRYRLYGNGQSKRYRLAGK